MTLAKIQSFQSRFAASAAKRARHMMNVSDKKARVAAAKEAIRSSARSGDGSTDEAEKQLIKAKADLAAAEAEASAALIAIEETEKALLDKLHRERVDAWLALIPGLLAEKKKASAALTKVFLQASDLFSIIEAREHDLRDIDAALAALGERAAFREPTNPAVDARETFRARHKNFGQEFAARGITPIMNVSVDVAVLSPFVQPRAAAEVRRADDEAAALAAQLEAASVAEVA